jgi:hypothetical protein
MDGVMFVGSKERQICTLARFHKLLCIVAGAGALSIVADGDGVFSASIDLQTLSPPPNTGDSLTFHAVWIGPTRERLKAEAVTNIQYSSRVVSLTQSVANDKLLPLQEFSVMSEVEPRENLSAAASITVCSCTAPPDLS